MDTPVSLRSAKTEKRYAKARKQPLTPFLKEKRLYEWTHWVMILNKFPYDMCFRSHTLLVPKRKVANRSQLTIPEENELVKIINDLQGNFDCMFENFPHMQSVPGHYHIHFGIFHEKRGDMKL